MLKRFHLDRKFDVSGLSGTGKVAFGVLFPDTGECVLHWVGEHASTNIYHSLDDLRFLHSHGNATEIVFDDPIDEKDKATNK